MENDIITAIEKNIPSEELADFGWNELKEQLPQIIKDNPIVENFPVVKVVFSVFDCIRSISDFALAKKLFDFIISCPDLSDAEIRHFLSTTGSDEQKDGSLLIEMLNKIDGREKTALSGRVFKYCAQHSDEMDVDAYFRILKCIERCYYADLRYLSEIVQKYNGEISNSGEKVSTAVVENLYSSGFLTHEGTEIGSFDNTLDVGNGQVYKVNLFGRIIEKCNS